MNCDWCDNEFETDDWIDDGEPGCEPCSQEFCSKKCQETHIEECHVISMS